MGKKTAQGDEPVTIKNKKKKSGVFKIHVEPHY